MEQRRDKSSYQHKRISGHTQNLTKSTLGSSKCTPCLKQRQSHCSSHLSKIRLKPIRNSSKNHSSNTTRIDTKKLHFRNTPHSREGSSSRRFFIKKRSSAPYRNPTFSRSLPEYNEPIRTRSPNRPFRNEIQSKIDSLSLLYTRSTSSTSQHLHNQLGKIQNTLCISSTQHYPQNPVQVEQREKRKPRHHRARLAHKELVFTVTDSNQEEGESTTQRERSVPNNQVRETVLPRPKISPFRTCIIRNHIPQEFSKSLKQKLLNPNKKSTSNHYQVHWKIFISFITERKLDINKRTVYEFFNHLINRKLSYGSILQYRSALTRPLHYLLPNLELLQDKVIKDLLQYTRSHNIKANQQFPYWKLDQVLEMLTSSQFRKLCNKDHSIFFKKVMFLILLASPKRISEFHALSLSKSTILESEVILRTHVKFIKKNASAFFNPQDITIPEFPENKELCPVFNLKKYLNITSTICEQKEVTRPDQLFIKEDASPYTLHQLRSSIREIIIRADPLVLKKNSSFHSVRKVASTILDYRGFSLQQIINSMQWKSSQTYTKYYCQIGLVDKASSGCIVAGKVLPST